MGLSSDIPGVIIRKGKMHWRSFSLHVNTKERPGEDTKR